MADTADPLAAELAAIRAETNVPGPRYADTQRLLALADAVLELADDWTAEASRLDQLADQAAHTDATALAIRRAALSHRAQVHVDFARELREATYRAMLGEEVGDEHG